MSRRWNKNMSFLRRSARRRHEAIDPRFSIARCLSMQLLPHLLVYLFRCSLFTSPDCRRTFLVDGRAVRRYHQSREHNRLIALFTTLLSSYSVCRSFLLCKQNFLLFTSRQPALCPRLLRSLSVLLVNNFAVSF